MKKSTLPVPIKPSDGVGADAARLEELRAKESDGKLSENESMELMLYEDEAIAADMSEQFLPELPVINIVHKEQVFKNEATGEFMKTLVGVMLWHRKLRVFWLGDDDEHLKAGHPDIVPFRDCSGPVCSSEDTKTGMLWNPDAGCEQPEICVTCRFNGDNRNAHPVTGGKCKLQGRALFIQLKGDAWSTVPVIIRLNTASVRNVSSFYLHNKGEGSLIHQLPVELSLEKKTRGEQVWSVVNITLHGEPITDIPIRSGLMAFRKEYKTVMHVPVSARDRSDDIDLDPSKAIEAEG